MTRATYEALYKALLDIHAAVDDAIAELKTGKAEKAEEKEQEFKRAA